MVVYQTQLNVTVYLIHGIFYRQIYTQKLKQRQIKKKIC